jgi:hypothetical protein
MGPLFTAAVCLALLGPRAGAAADREPLEPGTPLALLHESKVQKELKLTTTQVAEVLRLYAGVSKGEMVAADAHKRLAKELRPAQLQRLHQISRQVRGGSALLDEDVAAELMLTAKEKAQLRKIWAEEEAKLKDILARTRFASPKDRDGFIARHRKSAGERMLRAVTAEQARRFGELKGPAFDLTGLGAK